MDGGTDERGGPGAPATRPAGGTLQLRGSEREERGGGPSSGTLRVHGEYLWGGGPSAFRRGKFIHFSILIFQTNRESIHDGFLAL